MLVFKDGRIVEEGDVPELLRAETLEAIYGIPMGMPYLHGSTLISIAYRSVRHRNGIALHGNRLRT